MRIALTEKEKSECTTLWLLVLHMEFINEKKQSQHV